jgi:DNA mismatch repair protein MutS2
MNNYKTLEFDKILEQLADNAMSDIVKARCLALIPSLNETEVRRRIDETTQAKQIIEQTGTPPLPSMTVLQKIIGLIAVDVMLMPNQIAHVSSFLVSCRRMKIYLKKAEATGVAIAWYGESIDELSELENEIDRCIRNGVVDDRASSRLADIRRLTTITIDQIKAKLDALLRKNKDWFSENFVSIRNGCYTLPVKREHKNNVIGSVIDLSQTGGTCFIEPTSVGRLQSELSALKIEEDSEVRCILYSLTTFISENLPAIQRNIEAMETLDFIFAKGKLSLAMKASPIIINAKREIRIVDARHPLINPDTVVPLNFEVGNQTNGVIITGPNTGGKTVALKCVGLLSLMVQSGLHVPAAENSIFCLHNLVLCDIGDGQSITENLSTFSSHLKNIIGILRQANHESLVLLDELGSGTDPLEGMGLAIAILDELSAKKCLFVVTTHYPEVKEYAANKPGLVNARMAFDKESLLPLYRLEIGEAGESCAFYIAERLGLQQHLLVRAHEAAYGNSMKQPGALLPPYNALPEKSDIVSACACASQIVKEKELPRRIQSRGEKFAIGDSVVVYPQREIGIVYARSNDKGEIGVQVKGEKKLVNHKRIQLKVPADKLYPENYDFSIIFDSVANRKARHLMGKRHVKGNMAITEGDGK